MRIEHRDYTNWANSQIRKFKKSYRKKETEIKTKILKQAECFLVGMKT